MVITGNHQHATMFGCTCQIRMFEHVTATVHTRAFAVPHRKYTIVFGTREHIDLLRTPDRGCREIFIHAGMEFDVILIQMFFGFGSGQIDITQRRAAIATDETCCI